MKTSLQEDFLQLNLTELQTSAGDEESEWALKIDLVGVWY